MMQEYLLSFDPIEEPTPLILQLPITSAEYEAIKQEWNTFAQASMSSIYIPKYPMRASLLPIFYETMNDQT